MILSNLSIFTIKNLNLNPKRIKQKYIRYWNNIEIYLIMDLQKSKVKIKCDDCEKIFIGSLYNYFDKKKHYCINCYNKGDRSPTFGIKHSEKTKKLISKNRKGKLIGNKNPAKKLKRTTKELIQKCIETHGPDKYNYSWVKYDDPNKKILIFCNYCNKFFEQLPFSHINGYNCPHCSQEQKIIRLRKKYFKEWKIYCNKKYNNFYDYSKVNYIDSSIKVEIICPLHGSFFQTPSNHKKYGCKKCRESRGERKIRLWLEKNNIIYIKEKRFKDCKYKSSLPFDFYLPNNNICIEFDGIHHFQKVDYWMGDISFKERQLKDQIKNNYCKNKNIKLIRIPYTQYDEIDMILKEYLLQ